MENMNFFQTKNISFDYVAISILHHIDIRISCLSIESYSLDKSKKNSIQKYEK